MMITALAAAAFAGRSSRITNDEESDELEPLDARLF